jgi:Glycosyl transferases group 1
MSKTTRTRPPRIVVAGTPATGGLRNSLVTALAHSGCDVDVFDFGPWQPAWLASAAFRQPTLGVSFRYRLARHIDALAGNGPFDLLLVVKGPFLNARVIKHIRSRFKCPVVCWNPDSPFDRAVSNRGAGIRQAIRAYDAYITWADDLAERLSSVAARVLVCPFAWDPRIMRPTTGTGVAAGRIVFIGTATRERIAILRSLRHLHPIVCGSNWPEMPGVEIHPAVLGLEFCGIVGEAKWNLNLLRPQNARSHNMRTFELVGAGGSQVAPYTADHHRFLGGDSRTVLFENREELESILRSDPCARPPRSAAVLDGHTYDDRVRKLLADLGIPA